MARTLVNFRSWCKGNINSLRRITGLEDEIAGTKTVIDFKSSENIKDWVLGTDETFGGKSQCNLEYLPNKKKPDAIDDTHGRGIFSGNLSLYVPPGASKSGYCAIRKKLPFSSHELNGYAGFEMRVKTDGRKYFFNIQAERWNPQEIYQALFTTEPDQWETLQLPFDRMSISVGGLLLGIQDRPLEPTKIETIGMSLLDGKEGPFKVELEYIKAVRNITMHFEELPQTRTYNMDSTLF